MRRNTLSKSCSPSYAVKVPVRAPRCSSQPPVTTAPSKVPTTMTVRARADALGSFSLMPASTLQNAKRLRERCAERCDDVLVDCFLVAVALYQLDGSALRMGVLPLGIGELAKSLSDSVVKVIVGALHPVARSACIGAAQALRGGNIQEQRQIRNEASGGETVGRPDFVLRQSASEDLVSVGRQEEAIDESHSAFL